MNMVALGELMAARVPSVDPSKFKDEAFELWSIPAFDAGEPERALGNEIGSAKKLVQPNDILLSRIVPHIRRSWVVSADKSNLRKIASGEWIIFRSEAVDPEYLRQVLISDPFHNQFMHTVAGVGGSLLRARPEAVKLIKIPLPPLAEQRRIAAILDYADTVRRKRRDALSHLSRLEQAIFYDRFRRNENWTIGSEPLGNFVKFVTSGGRGWAKYYAEQGTRFIRSLDVQMGYISDNEPVYVEAPDSAEARRTLISPRDVLLTITGSRIGRVACVPDDFPSAHISQHVALIRLDQSQVSPDFAAFFLSLPNGGQLQIAKSQYGQTKPGLNFEQIRRFQIPLPKVSEQSQFLRSLEKLRETESLGLAHLQHSENLFASLQHRAFGGEL